MGQQSGGTPPKPGVEHTRCAAAGPRGPGTGGGVVPPPPWGSRAAPRPRGPPRHTPPLATPAASLPGLRAVAGGRPIARLAAGCPHQTIRPQSGAQLRRCATRSVHPRPLPPPPPICGGGGAPPACVLGEGPHPPGLCHNRRWARTVRRPPLRCRHGAVQSCGFVRGTGGVPTAGVQEAQVAGRGGNILIVTIVVIVIVTVVAFIVPIVVVVAVAVAAGPVA